MKVEICINSDQHVKESVSAAYLGGADTIELCSRMDLQGLTPTAKDIAIAREAFADRPGLMVMIRPRGGDFCYSEAEVKQMEREIETAVDHGADGVVFGAISDGKLDLRIMKRLVKTAKHSKMSVTCHRAFDIVENPVESLDLLINLGVSRLLTNGTPWGSNQTALEGIPVLNRLIEKADNKINIIIGGGIQKSNLNNILKQLLQKPDSLTIHAYSSLLNNGKTHLAFVKQLTNQVKYSGNL